MDPVLDLLGAIRARLRTDSGVVALVGTSVYDVPPEAATEPYISMGPSSYQSEDIECAYGGDVFVQIDAWSIEKSHDEIRKIAHAVRKAMRAEFTLFDTALVSLEHWRTDYLDDPDGITRHASIRFNGIVEET